MQESCGVLGGISGFSSHLCVDDVVQSIGEVRKPPPLSVFKLNFDAAVFVETQSSGFGAIIWNDKGEVMAVMMARGPPVSSSEEAELLACRMVVEFATDVGFSELVIEGDNSNVMRAIYFSMADLVELRCFLSRPTKKFYFQNREKIE